MTKTTHEKPRRSVVACRTLTLGTTIATAALGTGIMAAPAYPGIGHLDQISFAFPHSGDASVTLVAGGKSEGVKVRVQRPWTWMSHCYATLA